MKLQKKNKTSVRIKLALLNEIFFNSFLAFMIAILEQQVRENYEQQLKNSTIDKGKYFDHVVIYN
jgi:hypothetical protein